MLYGGVRQQRDSRTSFGVLLPPLNVCCQSTIRPSITVNVHKITAFFFTLQAKALIINTFCSFIALNQLYEDFLTENDCFILISKHFVVDMLFYGS